MTTGCLSKRTYSKLAFFSVLILLLMTGCHGNVSSSIPLVKDFYDSPKNWACLDSSIPIFASDYDVFFVYPTQIQKAAGLYFNWLSGNQGHEVHNYVAYHTQKQFGSRVRVFSDRKSTRLNSSHC